MPRVVTAHARNGQMQTANHNSKVQLTADPGEPPLSETDSAADVLVRNLRCSQCQLVTLWMMPSPHTKINICTCINPYIRSVHDFSVMHLLYICFWISTTEERTSKILVLQSIKQQIAGALLYLVQLNETFLFCSGHKKCWCLRWHHWPAKICNGCKTML